MGRKPTEKLCCVCRNVGHNFNKLTQKDENKLSLLTKFRLCISEVQWMPLFYLCSECVRILNIFYSFREKCIESEKIRKGGEQIVKGPVAECKEKYDTEPFFEENTRIVDSKEIVKGEKFIEDTNIVTDDLKEVVSTSDSPYSSESEQENEEHDNDNESDKGESSAEIPKRRNSRKKRTFIIKDEESRKKRNRKFGCEKCQKVFLASTKYVAHCMKDHGMEYKNIKPFSCDRCQQRFSTSSSLWQHIKYHDGVKSNMCSYCGKGFITKNDLLNHEKKHLNMREYKCESCGKSFNTHKDLRSHRLIVHTDSSHWKYICAICTKPFPIKSNYDSHMRRHIGDKKFACNLCEKKFATKCDLQRHTRSHSDVREHQCPHCEKEYKDSRVLKVHMAKAHGIGLGIVKIPIRKRNYACHFCPKAYYAKNKLTRHLYTHSGEKPFNCPICEKKFNDKSYVKQHLRNTHNIDNLESLDKLADVDFLNVDPE